MPAKSEKQRRFMYASLAGKTNVPPSVAKKFVGPKAHNDGGPVKETDVESKKMVKQELAFMKKKGAPKSMIAHEKKEAGMKKGGTAKYAKGGGIEAKGKTKGSVARRWLWMLRLTPNFGVSGTRTTQRSARRCWTRSIRVLGPIAPRGANRHRSPLRPARPPMLPPVLRRKRGISRSVSILAKSLSRR